MVVIELADKPSLKALILLAGLKDEEFADVIGVSKQTVSAWKAGRNKPNGKYIPEIERVLGVKHDDIGW